MSSTWLFSTRSSTFFVDDLIVVNQVHDVDLVVVNQVLVVILVVVNLVDQVVDPFVVDPIVFSNPVIIVNPVVVVDPVMVDPVIVSFAVAATISYTSPCCRSPLPLPLAAPAQSATRTGGTLALGKYGKSLISADHSPDIVAFT